MTVWSRTRTQSTIFVTKSAIPASDPPSNRVRGLHAHFFEALGLSSFANPNQHHDVTVTQYERGMSRMTSCRACGGMIAAGAATCPRCGAILSRISIIPVGLLVMLVIAVLYVLSQRYWLNPD
jgi:hypothetical protein